MVIFRDYRSLLRVRKRYFGGFDRDEKDPNFSLFLNAYRADDDAVALKYLKYVADCGHRRAQDLLGEFYCSLDPPAYEEAFKYFKLAADQDYPDALWHVGDLYRKGNGVERDIYSSFKYFKLSADGGNEVAQYDVGVCYIRGFGVARNVELAYHYFILSAQQNYLDALYYVGKFKLLGLVVSVDVKEAFDYFKLANPADYVYGSADKDIDEAILRLGSMNDLNDRKCNDSLPEAKRRRISWQD